MTYNRSLKLLEPSIFDPTKLAGVDLSKVWAGGALGGLASWIVSAPSELIKCRAQLCVDGKTSSFEIAKAIVKDGGVRGLYFGGAVTSLRDSIGYGFYFWAYELSKRMVLSTQADPFKDASTVNILVSGGIAGVITWTSIYPLDAVKTRMQAQAFSASGSGEQTGLLRKVPSPKGAASIAREMYRREGLLAFYRGLGVCSLRAFVVNAVQVFRTMTNACGSLY
jgi:solute carrier family 25 (mitochondrial carnitine/acylcarnitine transporter), member 20/29